MPLASASCLYWRVIGVRAARTHYLLANAQRLTVKMFHCPDVYSSAAIFRFRGLMQYRIALLRSADYALA